MSAPTSATATRAELNAAELAHFAELTVDLAELGRNFYGRGWLLGTSGNFSAVIRPEPLRLAVTPSGVDKGTLSREQILQVDEKGCVVGGSGKPSVETALHLTIVRMRKAAAVLHTHSVWSTLLSQSRAVSGGIAIEGYEMLKGLEGVHTHKHREWLPIIENSQNIPALAQAMEETLVRFPETHGLLLRGHGLYTWGRNLLEAKRHVEILEFLLEVVGRTGK